MRLYTFTNPYLSSISHGIQTAHVVAELFAKTHLYQTQLELYNWARHHKTIIVLNGGINQQLRELWDMMELCDHSYPYAKFNEDDASLGGVLTCVGIVLPASIYSPNPEVPISLDDFSNFDLWLIDNLSKFNTAR
jgi:hypothetical protein